MPKQFEQIPLGEFMPYLKQNGKKPSGAIAKYFQELLEKYNTKSGQLVTLPSIMLLARFFKANHLEVHDAFQALRSHGYDYDLKGMDKPITFWYKPTFDEQNATVSN